MMRRDTLNAERRVLKKFSYYPRVDTIRNLIDSHLEALDEIERLQAELNGAADDRES